MKTVRWLAVLATIVLMGGQAVAGKRPDDIAVNLPTFQEIDDAELIVRPGECDVGKPCTTLQVIEGTA